MKSSRRIALIGPVLPFRGGIAQHTTMLHRTAAPLTDLLTISFTRQYPALIFPGQSDRDPAYQGHREPGVEYLIDSLDPFSWRRAAARVLAHRPEMVVIPWWTIYWVFCFWYLARRFRHAGIRVVFLCHNVVEHESAGWKILLTRLALGQADRFMVHTRLDETNLKALLPKARIRRHPHPLYDQFPEPAQQLPRRARLELLFFGLVRPYKGLDLLLDALHQARLPVDFFLTIAGEFWQGKEALLRRIKENSLQEKIEILDRYIPEQQAADLFQRADLVVLPYRSATGSGIIPLAYHYNRPVLVTPVGGLPEVVLDGESGFVAEVPTAEGIARCLERGYDVLRDRQRIAQGIDKVKAGLSWESFVRDLLPFLDEHLGLSAEKPKDHPGA